MVQSSAAQVTGGDGICAMLRNALNAAEQVVQQAAEQQANEHHQRLRSQAEQNEQWRSLAGDLDMWEEDGEYAFGIPSDHPRYQDAMAAEYGDEQHPPSPLLRTGLLSNVHEIGWNLENAFRRAGF